MGSSAIKSIAAIELGYTYCQYGLSHQRKICRTCLCSDIGLLESRTDHGEILGTLAGGPSGSSVGCLLYLWGNLLSRRLQTSRVAATSRTRKDLAKHRSWNELWRVLTDRGLKFKLLLPATLLWRRSWESERLSRSSISRTDKAAPYHQYLLVGPFFLTTQWRVKNKIRGHRPTFWTLLWASLFLLNSTLESTIEVAKNQQEQWQHVSKQDYGIWSRHSRVLGWLHEYCFGKHRGVRRRKAQKSIWWYLYSRKQWRCMKTLWSALV